jgi:hypothetical protein
MFDAAFSFERFAVGTTNELAATAARRAAETPGSVYNPLVICGRSGIGKTHLLHAIGQYAQALDPDLAIRLENADGLAERVTQGLVRGRLTPLQEAFARLDMLLVDEVERIAGMERTQAELAGIASRMTAEGRQIVLATAVPPADLHGLFPELAAVLGRGVFVDIGPPDAAMRRFLVERTAQERGTVLTEDVTRALSAFDFQDVGGLKDAVVRLIDKAAVLGRGPHPHDVLQVVAEEVAHETPSGEFNSFLNDVSRTLAVVVEAAPWRRLVGEAILRWEGEGIRTDRLEQALEADTPPDVGALIEAFARDATRLLQIRRELHHLMPEEPLDDPDDLQRAESLLAALTHTRNHAPHGGLAAAGPAGDRLLFDTWFLNPDKLVLDWVDLDGRLVEEPR